MYTVGIYLYMLGVLIASLFHKKARLMVKGRWNTFRILRNEIIPGEQYVWFHAASLGEFEQGRPLMEKLRREHPHYKILLTFFSPSGYEVRKNYEGADIVCYLPFDTPGNVRSFMRLARPRMAFFIKYEFWQNYLRACVRNGIPTYSVSSIFRPNQIFFRWYGCFNRKVLSSFTHLYVQNDESRRLLASRNIYNTTVVGDTRFDRVLNIRSEAKELPIVEAFKQNELVFAAGSSWPVDEEALIEYFNRHTQWKLILAPHVVDEPHIKQILAQLKRKAVRYSQTSPAEAATADCLIIDGYGLLSSIYRYADLAYVGGGFGVGIHNVAEAAVYGIPVIIGPNNKRFKEAQDLMKVGGCFEIATPQEFTPLMGRFTSDRLYLSEAGQKAGNYIASNAGAVDTIFSSIVFW